jgi:threonine/homoserine/homoserine lactone efflux protein
MQILLSLIGAAVLLFVVYRGLKSFLSTEEGNHKDESKTDNN